MRGGLTALGLALALGASGASAQTVSPCDAKAAAEAIVEPWEAHARSFANGQTRLAVVDIIEPAAGAFFLLVLSPPLDMLGARQCRLVGMTADFGFAAIDFGALNASYDPATGLTFILPIEIPAPAGAPIERHRLTVILNQATGVITTQLERTG